MPGSELEQLAHDTDAAGSAEVHRVSPVGRGRQPIVRKCVVGRTGQSALRVEKLPDIVAAVAVAGRPREYGPIGSLPDLMCIHSAASVDSHVGMVFVPRLHIDG